MGYQDDPLPALAPVPSRPEDIDYNQILEIADMNGVNAAADALVAGGMSPQQAGEMLQRSGFQIPDQSESSEYPADMPQSADASLPSEPETRRAEPAQRRATGSRMDLSFIQRLNDPNLSEEQARAEYEKLPPALRYVYDRTADFSYNNQGSDTPAQLDPRDAAGWLDEFYKTQQQEAAKSNDPRSQAIIKQQEQRRRATLDGIGSMRQTVNDLLTHPGFSGSVGAKNQAYLYGLKSNPIAGTKEADFKAILDQVQGGAFLQAFESLKGGGQITQVEGEKATQAIVRAQQSQSEEGFKKSMNDFLDVLNKGERRVLGIEAGGSSSPAATPAAAATAKPSRMSGGIKYEKGDDGLWYPAQ